MATRVLNEGGGEGGEGAKQNSTRADNFNHVIKLSSGAYEDG